MGLERKELYHLHQWKQQAYHPSGPVEAARRVRDQIGDVATIVSVDMDVTDPGECPGVGFLETGVNKTFLL